MDMRKIKAIERANKERILNVCPDCPERSGIYFLLREENGFKYAYVGQAHNLLSRLAGHLKGYQHIDLSLKKHKFYAEDNPTGYKVFYLECSVEQLDELEQKYIKQYANAGYQMRNKTSGSQGEGKQGIAPNKQSKGYFDGVEQGKKNASKFVADLFAKHLDFVPKRQPPTKLQERAMQKFSNFLELSSKENNKNE